MPTTRPFAYNTGSTISGTDQLGNLAIGVSAQEYSKNIGGVKWWMGPDEDLGYVIAHQTTSGNQPNPLSVPAYLGFWRTTSKTDQEFINLSQYVSREYGSPQTFSDASQAKTWLNNNGYWTSYVIVTPTPTPTITVTPTITPTKTPTPTISITPTITPSTTQTSYTYYRWQITEAKTTPPNANCVQSAEFVFRLNGVDQSMAGVTVTNPGGSNPSGEEPSKLVDGNLNTKALDLNFVANSNVTNFIFQFGSAKAFNGYRWATANDEESRDPKSWTIAGSNNGTTWTTLHTVSGFVTTTTRNTYQTAQTY